MSRRTDEHTALVAGHLVAAVDVLAFGAALGARLRVLVEPAAGRRLLHRRLQRVRAVQALELRARLRVALLVLLHQRIQLTCRGQGRSQLLYIPMAYVHCRYEMRSSYANIRNDKS